MSNPDPVNSQITDAVTQTNVKVVGEAPAQAMGNLYQQMQQETNQPQTDTPQPTEE